MKHIEPLLEDTRHVIYPLPQSTERHGPKCDVDDGRGLPVLPHHRPLLLSAPTLQVMHNDSYLFPENIMVILEKMLIKDLNGRFGVIGGARVGVVGGTHVQGRRAGGAEDRAAKSAEAAGSGGAGGDVGAAGAGRGEVREVPVLDLDVSQLGGVVSWRCATPGPGM